MMRDKIASIRFEIAEEKEEKKKHISMFYLWPKEKKTLIGLCYTTFLPFCWSHVKIHAIIQNVFAAIKNLILFVKIESLSFQFKIFSSQIIFLPSINIIPMYGNFATLFSWENAPCVPKYWANKPLFSQFWSTDRQALEYKWIKVSF